MLAVILTVIVVVIVARLAQAFIRDRSVPSTAACINNLRQIDACKQQWALENHKSPNDVPTCADLMPYYSGPGTNKPPTCPQGGTYTIRRVADVPTCSIGGAGHSLDQ